MDKLYESRTVTPEEQYDMLRRIDRRLADMERRERNRRAVKIAVVLVVVLLLALLVLLIVPRVAALINGLGEAAALLGQLDTQTISDVSSFLAGLDLQAIQNGLDTMSQLDINALNQALNQMGSLGQQLSGLDLQGLSTSIYNINQLIDPLLRFFGLGPAV